MRLLLPGSARPRPAPAHPRPAPSALAGKLSMRECHRPLRYPFKACKPGFVKDPTTGLCCQTSTVDWFAKYGESFGGG